LESITVTLSSGDVVRQIVIPKSGEPDVMRVVECPSPIPGPGEVAIDVKYCGCNWGDTMMRRNTYPHPVTYPVVPGFEVSGSVSGFGPEVSGLRIGDRVAAYLSEDGGYAETCVVPAQCIIPLPPSIQLDVAAAFPVQALTAYFMLHLIGRVQPGWVVLIHAVGGGVGLCLTQLAVKAGAKVIGSVGAAGKERRPLEFGASRVVNREEEDFVAAALEMTGGGGVDLLLDSLGASTLDRSFAALRTLGHAISYGEAEGRPFPNLWERMVPKSLTLTRFHMGHVQVGSAVWRAAVSHVLAGIVEGWLRIPIEGIYPLREAAAMHARLESRKVAGKLLLATRE
jgi:NADPH:quinone reductase